MLIIIIIIIIGLFFIYLTNFTKLFTLLNASYTVISEFYKSEMMWTTSLVAYWISTSATARDAKHLKLGQIFKHAAEDKLNIEHEWWKSCHDLGIFSSSLYFNLQTLTLSKCWHLLFFFSDYKIKSDLVCGKFSNLRTIL